MPTSRSTVVGAFLLLGADGCGDEAAGTGSSRGTVVAFREAASLLTAEPSEEAR